MVQFNLTNVTSALKSVLKPPHCRTFFNVLSSKKTYDGHKVIGFVLYNVIFIYIYECIISFFIYNILFLFLKIDIRRNSFMMLYQILMNIKISFLIVQIQKY